MAKTDVWMPMYWADFLADTQHLKRADLGSYMLLIASYWRRGGPLPDDDEELCQMARCDAADWPKTRQKLIAMFQPKDGFWWHKRVEAELEKARHNREVASQKGRLGAEKRHGVSRSYAPATAPAIAEPKLNVSSSPSSSPSPLEHIPVVEAELPKNFPKTEQEAINACMTAGLPDDFVKDVYHKALSRGGKDAKECPILYWASYAKTEWKYQQNRVEKEKHENRQPFNRQSPDRNAGTANAGKASEYSGLGKVAKP